MLLSQSLLTSLARNDFDISGVNVFCDDSIRGDVKSYFLSVYTNRWNRAKKLAEQKYGDCASDNIPIEIFDKEYGFLISVGELEIRYCCGDFYDAELGYMAFENALKSMKAKYPQIDYDGYIGYILSDRRYGEAVQWEITSNIGAKIYNFVGETLEWVFDVNNSEMLSLFWKDFEDLLKFNKDFQKTIQDIYAYSKWIKKENIDNAVSFIIKIADETDEHLKEKLFKLVEKLEAGEKIEEKDSENDIDFNDEYDVMLTAIICEEALAKAEGNQNLYPERFELEAAVASFPRIAAKAKDGDEFSIQIINALKSFENKN